MSEPTFRFYDHQANKSVIERSLPHWSQAGTLCFITWRTEDSIPTPIFNRWRRERDSWLQAHEIEPNQPGWRDHVDRLTIAQQKEFRILFSTRWHEMLDCGHGACVLRQPELAKIVSDSLHHFDGDRYVLTDFVVMPNHVHVLCAFATDNAMLAQCRSWKHFTATKINRHLGRKNRFWQEDGFDHLVRNEDQMLRLRKYIAENPIKCRLRLDEYGHFAKQNLLAKQNK